MNPYALSAVSVANEDVLKVLLIILFGAGLLALGRWSSSLGATTQDHPLNIPTPDASEALPSHSAAVPELGPGPEDIAASFPFDASLGKIRITKFFFLKVDAIPGPENSRAFADELTVELYDPDSGDKWWQSYFVATPEGLANLLRERSWKFLYSPNVLVFPEYDLEEIRRAVVSRIKADHDFFTVKQDSGEESL